MSAERKQRLNKRRRMRSDASSAAPRTGKSDQSRKRASLPNPAEHVIMGPCLPAVARRREQTTRATSKAVYDRIQSNGLLGKRQWEVWSLVFYHGPVTTGEAFHIMAGQRDQVSAELALKLPQVRARFSELAKAGLLAELGETECSFTGERVILWDVTQRVPEPNVGKKTKKQRDGINAATIRAQAKRIEELEERLARVEAALRYHGLERNG